jgi:hypothetical protein
MNSLVMLFAHLQITFVIYQGPKLEKTIEKGVLCLDPWWNRPNITHQHHVNTVPAAGPAPAPICTDLDTEDKEEEGLTNDMIDLAEPLDLYPTWEWPGMGNSLTREGRG